MSPTCACGAHARPGPAGPGPGVRLRDIAASLGIAERSAFGIVADLAECAGCGNTRPVSSRDRAGQPWCAKCPDADGRDPVAVIHGIISVLDPHASPDTAAAAVHRSAPRPAYQRQLAWALEEHPGLLTAKGHLAPLRAIPRLIDSLHAAGVAGIVRPECPGCHRVVRIDKPLNGVRPPSRRLRRRSPKQNPQVDSLVAAVWAPGTQGRC